VTAFARGTLRRLGAAWSVVERLCHNAGMRLGLLQLNAIVGDLDGNAARIARAVAGLAGQPVDLCVTPEMSITGYPARDLLLHPGFVARSLDVARDLARRLSSAPPVLVGLPEANPEAEGRPLFNAAMLLAGGEARVVVRKTLLPTYDVFDEDRYFEPWTGSEVVPVAGRLVALSICEDIWNDRAAGWRRRYHRDPLAPAREAGASLLINMSASPFAAGKQQIREGMLAGLATRRQIAVAYVNQVGGNDDLVFDGRSVAVSTAGAVIARAASFREDALVVDPCVPPGSPVPAVEPEEEEVYEALVLGTRDYTRKCGFTDALVGLSGGIDSALTAAIAVDALGAARVLGVLMPSPYSTAGSVSDALDLAARLGIRTVTIPIDPIMSAFDAALAPAFAGRAADVTEENIQARIRGNLLMALSNKHRSLLLTTGNKSELAVGYCTLYGDMSGGLAVIADVPKTMVYRIARWLNARRPVIPEATMTKPPSAELRPNQTDQDSLPSYDDLDAILERHIERHESLEQIVASGHDEATVRRVLRLVRIAEFKRKQAAPGLKVTDRAFGSGWRMPIARGDWDRPGGPASAEPRG
jgi:NAD+ synthase (glutamine-hydrolysing)